MDTKEAGAIAVAESVDVFIFLQAFFAKACSWCWFFMLSL